MSYDWGLGERKKMVINEKTEIYGLDKGMNGVDKNEMLANTTRVG